MSKTSVITTTKVSKRTEIGQLKRVKCTYPNCNKHFDKVKEMKNHKKEDPDHFYCKKCDVDCEDWEDLTQHKVDAMQPFIEGRSKHNMEEGPMHIVCEFCGMDFGSFGGRKKHREQNHRADQNIVCTGCRAIFIRAGDLVAHYESGKCPAISKYEYLGHVQQKHITKEIMKDPETFLESLAENRESKTKELSYDLRSDSQDADEGGVNLLETEDEQQKLGLSPLQAEVDLIDVHARPQQAQSETERWPYLKSQKPSQLSESMRSMSLRSEAESVYGSEATARDSASQATSRRGGMKVYTESYPPLSETFVPASEITVSAHYSTAWTTGKTSQALFQGAKPTPPPGDWDGILKHREEEARQNNSTNLLHARFWDPRSPDYNIDMFFNQTVEAYCCPFDGCDEAMYEDRSDLEGHLYYAHYKTSFTCPLCKKRFTKGSQLIHHADSGGKCKVKKSTMFGQLLDEVGGGFLKVKHLDAPKIYKDGKDGTAKEGIMDARFEAKMPHER